MYVLCIRAFHNASASWIQVFYQSPSKPWTQLNSNKCLNEAEEHTRREVHRYPSCGKISHLLLVKNASAMPYVQTKMHCKSRLSLHIFLCQKRTVYSDETFRFTSSKSLSVHGYSFDQYMLEKPRLDWAAREKVVRMMTVAQFFRVEPAIARPVYVLVSTWTTLQCSVCWSN